MLKIYYTVITQLPPPEIVLCNMQLLPLPAQQKIAAYNNPLQRMLQLSSKLLLNQLITAFALDEVIGLADIATGNKGKPGFNKALHFNSARSGNIAVCAATSEGDIGIDIEKITTVDIALYQDYFTDQEWTEINNSVKPVETFFTLWTKKEAVIKAAGGGLNIALDSIEVLSNPVNIGDNDYYLAPVLVQDGYVCHVASVIEKQEMEVREVVLFEGMDEGMV